MDFSLRTQGYHNTHYLSSRLLKSVFDNALLEHSLDSVLPTGHGVLHHILPVAVHLNLFGRQVEGTTRLESTGTSAGIWNLDFGLWTSSMDWG